MDLQDLHFPDYISIPSGVHELLKAAKERRTQHARPSRIVLHTYLIRQEAITQKCEKQIGICVVPQSLPYKVRPQGVRDYNMSMLVQRSFAAFGGSCAPGTIASRE